MTATLPLCVLVTLLVHRTSAITTTPSFNGCYYEGKHYKHRETIATDPDNCYGSICDSGGVLIWDAKCFFVTSPCAGINVHVPGQCCPECIETTTPTTTTPTEPPGCYVNGFHYAFDTDIPQTDPCKICTCTRQNGVMCAVAACGMVQCVNPVKKMTDCCATCPDGPNCWYGKRKIKVGETYSPTPNMECACPDHWDPLATCRKLPASKSFLRKKLKRQGIYMNPLLKEYIKKYLNL